MNSAPVSIGRPFCCGGCCCSTLGRCRMIRRLRAFHAPVPRSSPSCA